MKLINLKRALYLTVFALFLSFQISAQSEDRILDHIENPEIYETIDLAQMDRNLSTFVSLVGLSGLAPSFEFTGEHTLFVPTNKAFGEMSIERFAELTNPENRAELIEFIQYHVIPEKVMKAEFQEDQIINTEDAEDIGVSSSENNNMVTIGGAEIIKADIEASNGVIHIVNRVIEPNVSMN